MISTDERSRLLDDMATFASLLVESRDLDPLYPVLKHLYRNQPLESALWMTWLYLSYYNLASAYRVWREFPLPAPLPEWTAKLPFATERRGFRTPAHFHTAMNAYVEMCQQFGQVEYLQFGWTHDDPGVNYELTWKWTTELPGVGRWAAFKWGELLQKVHGWNLAAPDMRMKFCTGPKEGLLMVYDLPENTPLHRLNAHGKILWRELERRGVEVGDWETLETILCNFHSLCDGRYYVGLDIDELQQVIDHSALTPNEKEVLYQVRREVLPHAYLGELNGWSGVSQKLKKQYLDYGRIITRPQFEGDKVKSE